MATQTVQTTDLESLADPFWPPGDGGGDNLVDWITEDATCGRSIRLLEGSPE